MSSACRRSPRAPALPPEIALPAGESARAVTLGDGWLAVVTVDAAGRERIRVLDRATGAERAVTEIAPAMTPAIELRRRARRAGSRRGRRMDVEGEVARHYAQSELTRTVLDALRAAGKDLDALDAADLSAVDEFHTGWGPQTVELAKTLDLAPGLRGARRRLGHRRAGALLRRASTAATSPGST